MTDQPAPPQTAGDTVQAEAARQAVILAFSILGVLVMIAAQRAAGDPDFYRMIRMRASRAAERVLATTAARAWTLAERARRVYESNTA